MRIKFIKFSDQARTPERAHPTDSGADLFVANTNGDAMLWAGETRVYWTDIGIELPEGYEAQVRPRSSWSSKGVHVALGSVDQTYRGNLGVTVTNATREHIPIPRGTKIAQLVVCPVALPVFELAESISSSDRQDKGFGSSGAK
jgi:dUTP pyrophosphatase